MEQSNRACLIEGCAKPYSARGYCRLHYMRLLKHGDPLIVKKRPNNPDAAHWRACSVDGCIKLVDCRGWCATHYSRWRRTGDPGGLALKREPSPVSCSVLGCASSPKAGGYCNAHYARKHRYGDAEYLHENKCSFCGASSTDLYPKKHCSKVCEQMSRVYGGARPATGECVRCGGEINFLGMTRHGQYKRIDTKMCVECKRGRGIRLGYSVDAIVAIHGTTDCGICGDPVNLRLKHPDVRRASIDHVIPYAHGGSNEPTNLQLAHLHCNHVKSDRI